MWAAGAGSAGSILRLVAPETNWDRSADLETIKAAYAQYDTAGRARLWDDRNPGYGMLVADLRRRLLAFIGASLSRDVPSRVLDLGCGTGDLFREVASLGLPLDWQGVDLRPEVVADAEASYPGAVFHVASADQVPLPAASCDVVIAQVLFSSLPSPQLELGVASEVSRLLKPGGWLVWMDIRYSNPANAAVHGISAARLSSLFPSWKADLASVGLIPPVARRLGPAAGILYPLLSTVPALRSHLVGRLRRPGSHL